MLLYSQTINSFISRLKSEARDILLNEIGLEFYQQRYKWKGYLYPLHFVVFEKSGELGFFNAQTHQVGLHKSLMYNCTPEVLKNILRHELAHLMTHLHYGPEARVHGPEFRALCASYGWDERVWNASANLQEANREAPASAQVEQILAKVQKLLKLAASTNSHEAELATAKANELLLKYNLESLALTGTSIIEESTVYVQQVLSAKRYLSKWRAIYDILQHFYVQPVVNYGQGVVNLEVAGDKLNVELADYIAKFLDVELEHLWERARKENPKLKGTASKNSFFRGVAKGFIEKIQQQKQQIPQAGPGLVLLEKQLKEKVKLAYSRLGASYSQSQTCLGSEQAGRQAGRSLSINPGLKSRSAGTLLLSP